VHNESDERFAYELAACEACILQAERELELLGWLPTSAVCTIIERVGRERARQRWLLRLRWRGEPCEDLTG
jgi:hypothetical protein